MTKSTTLLTVLLFVLAATLLSAADKPTIIPEDSDIGYGSSAIPDLWYPGRGYGSPYFIGKGNIHDHRYRLLVRIPLDKLLPSGQVSKSSFKFKIAMYNGVRDSRKYLVEAIDDDLMVLQSKDLSTKNTYEIARFEFGRESAGQTFTLDLTDAVQHALDEVWSGLTIRFRPVPEDEENDDPAASGAAIDINSLRLKSK